MLPFSAPFLSGEPEIAEEVGDGNVNLVFRVRSDVDSIVVKQALPYLRLVGEEWPLTKDRARIEAEALALEDQLAPGRVPKLRHYDEMLYALVIEDLDGYIVLRHGMFDQIEYRDAFAHIAVFAARTLLGTSFLLTPADERRALALRFDNPELCAITEDLIFTSPFIESPSIKIDSELEPYAKRLRENRAACREAARLRHDFRTRAEAIVHGDLHTGSVMVNSTDTRVIDPEFAFPGPMAFDTGKLMGNLVLAFLGHRSQGHTSYCDLIAQWLVQFWNELVEEVRSLWPANEPWREAFIADLFEDSCRYAGAVMCRRTVGLAGVRDIRGIADRGLRLRAEVAALDGGAALLSARTIGDLADFWGIATETGDYS